MATSDNLPVSLVLIQVAKQEDGDTRGSNQTSHQNVCHTCLTEAKTSTWDTGCAPCT